MWFYKMIAFFKGLRRRMLVDKATYDTYDDPDAVGGWAGYYELDGECIAFRDVNNNLSFEW
jgi:hypothetical protein